MGIDVAIVAVVSAAAIALHAGLFLLFRCRMDRDLALSFADDDPAKRYWFDGNFQAYQENKVARLGEDAARPHRLHKKLVRG